jgi:hypothetical protein
MGELEATLQSLGVCIGSYQAGTTSLGGSDTLHSLQLQSSFSGYGEYTPVTVRSSTVRTDNADVERNQSRD